MPILGLRRPPPPPPPVSRTPIITGAEDFVLGWRLPSVVAPPPDGALRLLPQPLAATMRVPCNISVDPRLCKGSVFANRRKFLEQNKSQGIEESREEHYRVNVLRSRLTGALPHFPAQAGSSNGHIGHAQTNGFSLPKASHLRRTSALKKTPPDPIQLPQLAAGSIDKGFRKLKFVPLRNVSNIEERGKKTFPSRVVPALGRVRTKAPALVSAAPTPPCSERPEYPIIETAVQTDDPFDTETTDLVRDLANQAIELAMHNLYMEETVRGLTKKTEDIKRQLDREKQLKKELEVSSKRKLEEKEKELREKKEQEEAALAANKLAVITCKEVTARSLLRIKALEELEPRTRSIGQDTRQLNQLQEKVDLVHAELEKDFFPWMFARAEKIFKNKWSYTQMQSQRRRSRKSLK